MSWRRIAANSCVDLVVAVDDLGGAMTSRRAKASSALRSMARRQLGLAATSSRQAQPARGLVLMRRCTVRLVRDLLHLVADALEVVDVLEIASAGAGRGRRLAPRDDLRDRSLVDLDLHLVSRSGR
jgi:hypothetical protein